MSVRVRQPLPPVCCAVNLSHDEYKKNDNGKVEKVKVDDCRFLCDPEDYDLEVLQRSGANLKEVPTTLFQHSLVYPKVTEEENQEQEPQNDKEN